MPRRSRALEQLEFEIVFYEKLLRAYPDFLDVLIPLGHAYTRRGLHEKALQIDLRLTQLKGEDPLTWYNLACSYALLLRSDEAIGALQRAIELGYTDLAYLQQDPDLRHIRQSEQYRQFLASCSSLLTAKTAPANPSAPSSP